VGFALDLYRQPEAPPPNLPLPAGEGLTACIHTLTVTPNNLLSTIPLFPLPCIAGEGRGGVALDPVFFASSDNPLPAFPCKAGGGATQSQRRVIHAKIPALPS
jgi:hypothetical protein